jgi:hypothetical protein
VTEQHSPTPGEPEQDTARTAIDTTVPHAARARAVARYAATWAVSYRLRTPERIEGFFAGLELVDPGVVSVSQWRAEATPSGLPAKVDSFCGVGRKP